MSVPWLTTSKRKTGELVAKKMNPTSSEVTASRLKICQFLISSCISGDIQRIGGVILELPMCDTERIAEKRFTMCIRVTRFP